MNTLETVHPSDPPMHSNTLRPLAFPGLSCSHVSHVFTWSKWMSKAHGLPSSWWRNPKADCSRLAARLLFTMLILCGGQCRAEATVFVADQLAPRHRNKQAPRQSHAVSTWWHFGHHGSPAPSCWLEVKWIPMIQWRMGRVQLQWHPFHPCWSFLSEVQQFNMSLRRFTCNQGAAA